jgi:hypothetical protein
MVIEDWKAA